MSFETCRPFETPRNKEQLLAGLARKGHQRRRYGSSVCRIIGTRSSKQETEEAKSRKGEYLPLFDEIVFGVLIGLCRLHSSGKTRLANLHACGPDGQGFSSGLFFCQPQQTTRR